MLFKKFIITAIILCLLLIAHCLEEVKFILKTETNATLIIIRDGGNEDDGELVEDGLSIKGDINSVIQFFHNVRM